MSNQTLRSLFTATAIASCLATSFSYAADEVKPPLVTINGETVTEMDRDTQKEQFVARGQTATDEQIVDELVSLELMRQEAVKQGLDKTEKMAAEMKIMRARVLANALLTNYTAGIDLSDDVLRAEYDKQISMAEAKEYQASHILVDDEAKAKEIITELNDGADFTEAAKKYSTGPSAPNGGDLGWFDSGAMVPEFSAAVAELETGKYSTAPVQTQFGWHIIKLVDSRSKNPQPFETVKDQIRNMVMRTNVEKFVKNLHDAATIERP